MLKLILSLCSCVSIKLTLRTSAQCARARQTFYCLQYVQLIKLYVDLQGCNSIITRIIVIYVAHGLCSLNLVNE